MPNIKQQERRIRTAARQRLENLRWRSATKTLHRRLVEAVDAGDETEIAETHRRLVRSLDRASARGAIHPNRAARKKSQAARLVASRDSG
jgi:small subunit ribosomal protein S20